MIEVNEISMSMRVNVILIILCSRDRLAERSRDHDPGDDELLDAAVVGDSAAVAGVSHCGDPW